MALEYCRQQNSHTRSVPCLISLYPNPLSMLMSSVLFEPPLKALRPLSPSAEAAGARAS
jgi:hypothetical protein